MGFFSFLFKTNKLNADPTQQALAQMIIAATEGRQRESDILVFLHRQGWSRSDQGNHLTHALSMVKVFRADLYPRASEICRQIYVVLPHNSAAVPAMLDEKDRPFQGGGGRQTGLAERWNALVKYDNELRAAAEELRPFGESLVNELAQAYFALNEDKQYLASIVRHLVEDAKRNEEERRVYRFRTTFEGEVCTERSLGILREAEVQGWMIGVQDDKTFTVTKRSGTSYLRSNSDIERFGRSYLSKPRSSEKRTQVSQSEEELFKVCGWQAARQIRDQIELFERDFDTSFASETRLRTAVVNFVAGYFMARVSCMARANGRALGGDALEPMLAETHKRLSAYFPNQVIRASDVRDSDWLGCGLLLGAKEPTASGEYISVHALLHFMSPFQLAPGALYCDYIGKRIHLAGPEFDLVARVIEEMHAAVNPT